MLVAAGLTVESQAELGVIPVAAATSIRAGCSVTALDWDKLRKDTDIVGYPILPLIKQLEGMCADGGGKYLVSGVRRRVLILSALGRDHSGCEFRSQNVLTPDHGFGIGLADEGWSRNHRRPDSITP